MSGPTLDGETAAAPVAEEGGEEGGHADYEITPVTKTWTWWSNGGVTFEAGMLLDGMSVMMLFVVTLISLLVHVYSTDYVSGDRRYTHFFAFLSLFSAAMLGFVMAQNTLQLITLWELVGVCSFALIGHWWEEKPNSDAALKAFLTNRVGDVGLLVGMITLFFAADLRHRRDQHARQPGRHHPPGPAGLQPVPACRGHVEVGPVHPPHVAARRHGRAHARR